MSLLVWLDAVLRPRASVRRVEMSRTVRRQSDAAKRSEEELRILRARLRALRER